MVVAVHSWPHRTYDAWNFALSKQSVTKLTEILEGPVAWDLCCVVVRYVTEEKYYVCVWGFLMQARSDCLCSPSRKWWLTESAPGKRKKGNYLKSKILLWKHTTEFWESLLMLEERFCSPVMNTSLDHLYKAPTPQPISSHSVEATGPFPAPPGRTENFHWTSRVPALQRDNSPMIYAFLGLKRWSTHKKKGNNEGKRKATAFHCAYNFTHFR